MVRVLLSCLALLVLGSSLAAGPITLTARERDRLKKETIHAIDLIQRYHYKQKSFSEVDSADLLRAYIDDLDGSRLFILQEDVDFVIERFAGSLKPAYLFTGDLFPAFEIFNLYHRRSVERLQWVSERLRQPFDFSGDGAYLTDRSKAERPATREEADRIWEARLTHELILELIENEPLQRALDKVAVRYERVGRFLDEIEIHNVQETFLTSLARLYDPHSNFFSWDSAQEFDIQISNLLVGIGAQLRDIDGYCVIERLMPGGPAEMSGKLHPGDKIVAVGQGGAEPVDVVGMKLRRIVQLIRGEIGTEVRLTVIPASGVGRKVISLVRDKVELTANLASADLYELPDEDGKPVSIGVIRLPSFYGEGAFGEGNMSTSRDMRELIGQLKEAGISGLVLDLRNNGGGRLDEAIKVTGLFISKGPVVMKRSFNGEIEEDWDRDPDVAWKGPLAVLVSRTSASASEIVAGALQSHGRAIVVGDEATHGKGTVQAPIDLRNTMRTLPFSGALQVGTVKVTVQQFYLPNGDSTQHRGVLADIALPSANMFLLEGEGNLDHALAWDQIQPIDFQLPERTNPAFAMARSPLLEQLAGRSARRQAADPEFGFLNQNIAWFRERHERKEASLNLEQRRAEKDAVEAMRKHFEEQRDQLSRELAYPVRPVKLALTGERERSHQEKLRSTPLPDGRPRANQFYQKVFYYEAPDGDRIHDIWIDSFNYDRALRHAEELAEVVGARTGMEIAPEQMTDILTRLRNADRGADFDVLAPFLTVLGEATGRDALLEAMPAFFTRLVELDPDVLLERAKLDIHLREGLRIVRDWIELESPLSPARLAAVAALTESGEAAAATAAAPARPTPR